MKIIDTSTPTQARIGDLSPGVVIQSGSGEFWLCLRNETGLHRQIVNLRSGELVATFKDDRSFVLRSDLVLTTESNLKERGA